MSKTKKVLKHKKDRAGQKYSFNLKLYKHYDYYYLHEDNNDLFDNLGNYNFNDIAAFCSIFSRITGIKLKHRDLRRYKVTLERIPLENF